MPGLVALQPCARLAVGMRLASRDRFTRIRLLPATAYASYRPEPQTEEPQHVNDVAFSATQARSDACHTSEPLAGAGAGAEAVHTFGSHAWEPAAWAGREDGTQMFTLDFTASYSFEDTLTA